MRDGPSSRCPVVGGIDFLEEVVLYEFKKVNKWLGGGAPKDAVVLNGGIDQLFQECQHDNY